MCRSQWEEYSGGAQTLSYRRLMEANNRHTNAVDYISTNPTGEWEDANQTSAVSLSADPLSAHKHGRALMSVRPGDDWRMRMVFFPGDERETFYRGMSGVMCAPDAAINDPSCRIARRTHKEVAYSGYGGYRNGCTLNSRYNAWVCNARDLIPARFIIESMDADAGSRRLQPVALASAGYVDLMNSGFHQLQQFITIVAVNRTYDLAFTSTNPRHLRLMFPNADGRMYDYNRPGDLTGRHVHAGALYHHTAQQTRVIITLFYSNPEMLEVYTTLPRWTCSTDKGCRWEPIRKLVRPLEFHMPNFNSYNFSMRKPVITDPCGSNAFAMWEKKIYVLVCGGPNAWVEIYTIPIIVLSIGVEVSVEQFFDQHYFTRNLCSLFSIPAHRMRVPRPVAENTRRRRLSDGTVETTRTLSIEFHIDAVDPCSQVSSCGENGECTDGACVCNEGWQTPTWCEGGECECSEQSGCDKSCSLCVVGSPSKCVQCPSTGVNRLVHNSSCAEACPSLRYFADPEAMTCAPCHSTCLTCSGATSDICTSCDSVGANAYMLNGVCVARCPSEGYYVDANRVCLPCHSSCRRCAGPRATECHACHTNPCALSTCPAAVRPILDVLNFWTVYHQVAHRTGVCVSSCPAGRAPRPMGAGAGGGWLASFVHQASTQYECAPCASACRVCRVPLSTRHCIGCNDGASGNGQRCRYACSDGGYPVTIKQYKIRPDVGYTLDYGTRPGCGICRNYDCQTCLPDDPYTCVLRGCKANYVRSVTPALGQNCTENCPNTSYVTSTRQCEPCHSSCQTCDGAGAHSCLTCDAMSTLQYMHRGQCLAACPPGFAPNATNYCEPCDPSCATCLLPATHVDVELAVSRAHETPRVPDLWNWFQGAAGESCDQTCASQGGRTCDHGRTHDVMTEAQMRDIAAATGVTCNAFMSYLSGQPLLNAPAQCTNPHGCGQYFGTCCWNSWPWPRDTTCSSKFELDSRFCHCSPNPTCTSCLPVPTSLPFLRGSVCSAFCSRGQYGDVATGR